MSIITILLSLLLSSLQLNDNAVTSSDATTHSTEGASNNNEGGDYVIADDTNP
jgi:hypothetical protein